MHHFGNGTKIGSKWWYSFLATLSYIVNNAIYWFQLPILQGFCQNHSSNHIYHPIYASRGSFFLQKSILSTDNLLDLYYMCKVPKIAKMCQIFILLLKSLSKIARLGAISFFDQIGSNLAQVTFGSMSTISPIKKFIRKFCQNYGNSIVYPKIWLLLQESLWNSYEPQIVQISYL